MTGILRRGGVRTACASATGGGPAYGAVESGGFCAGRIPMGMSGDAGRAVAFGFTFGLSRGPGAGHANAPPAVKTRTVSASRKRRENTGISDDPLDRAHHRPLPH